MRGLHSSGCALLVLHREGVAEEAKVAKVVVESVISDSLHVFEREDTNLRWPGPPVDSMRAVIMRGCDQCARERGRRQTKYGGRCTACASSSALKNAQVCCAVRKRSI